MNVGRADVDQFTELLDHSLAACGAVTTGRAK
jgi:hypothetical protein